MALYNAIVVLVQEVPWPKQLSCAGFYQNNPTWPKMEEIADIGQEQAFGTQAGWYPRMNRRGCKGRKLRRPSWADDETVRRQSACMGSIMPSTHGHKHSKSEQRQHA